MLAKHAAFNSPSPELLSEGRSFQQTRNSNVRASGPAVQNEAVSSRTGHLPLKNRLLIFVLDKGAAASLGSQPSSHPSLLTPSAIRVPSRDLRAVFCVRGCVTQLFETTAAFSARRSTTTAVGFWPATVLSYASTTPFPFGSEITTGKRAS